MKTEEQLNERGINWVIAGLLLLAGALGIAVAMFVLHTAHETPWWVIAFMCALALGSVWCFSVADVALDVAAEDARNRRLQEALHERRAPRQRAENYDPPEFGPGQYAGPERRRPGHNPTRPLDERA